MKKSIVVLFILFEIVLQAQVYKNNHEYIYSIEIFNKQGKHGKEALLWIQVK